MFNFKRTLTPRTLKNKIKLTSFEGGLNLKKAENIMPLASAYRTYNFSHTTGALKEGLGIEDFASTVFKKNTQKNSISEQIGNLGSCVASFVAKKFNSDTLEREDKFMFMSEDKRLHFLPLNLKDDETNIVLSVDNLVFHEKPNAINYRLNGEDCTIFTSPKDPMIVWGLTEKVMKVVDAPHISSMTMHYERLFATVDGEKSSVWFSDDLDPTNWSVSLTEAGFIEMLDERGALKKVLSFNDYVYVFRDYGITRISAIADQTTFSVAQLFVSSGKIFTNTVMLCGDIIIFLASDGLYKFDGLNCVKILTNIENGFLGQDNASAVAGYFESKYYLACNFNFGEDKLPGETNVINNCLIEIDLNTMQAIFMRGADVIDINTVLSDEFCGVVVCAKSFGNETYKLGVLSHSGKIFGKSTHKVWQTPFTDLGYPQKQKCVRNIFINSKSDCSVIVRSDENGKKVYEVKGSVTPVSLSTRIYGTKFSFEFATDCDECEITNPNIYIKMDNRF